MAYEVEGKTIEATDNGYLIEISDWSDAVGAVIAVSEGIDMTERHWDVVKYLRDEHINNNASEPNERTILKTMSKLWGEKISSKVMYEMFPTMPSKQGRMIAGLPQSTRKGGY